MSIQNNRISAPIGLQEVYSLLGVQKTGTYYDVGYICGNAHGQINKWSKKKPTRYDNPNGGASWWKANDGNCGFSGMSYYDQLTIVQAYQQNLAWIYNAPRPGTDWCRLTDFEGYDHNAQPFLTAPFGNGEEVEVNRYLHPTLEYTFMRNTSAYSVQPSDFADGNIHTIEDGRLAAIIFPGTHLQPYPNMGTPLSIQYGDTIAGSSAPSIELDFTDIRVGGTSVVFAISFETMGTSFLPLPGAGNGNLGYWISVNVTETAAEATFMLDMMGFRNNYVNTPLTPMQYLIDTSNPNYAPLKVYERGIVSFQITILAGQKTYTIHSATQFGAYIDYGGLTGIADGYLRIKSINGNTSISYPYETSDTVNTVIVLENNSLSDAVFPAALTDGAYTIRIKDKRLGTSAPDLCRRDNVHLDKMG